MSNNFDQEALDEFVVESRELLEQAESDLMAIDVEQDPIDQETINRIFRAVHSVKGVAGFFGLTSINDLSHSMESLLMKIRDRDLAPTAEMIDVLLKNNDRLRSLVNDVVNSNNVVVAPFVEEISWFLTPKSRAPAPIEAVDTSKDSSEKKDTQGKELSSNEFVLDNETKKKLNAGGYNLFVLTLDPHTDLDSKGRSFSDMMDNLNTLGSVIHCNYEIDEINKLPQESLDSLEIKVVISTVLEPALAATGFEVSTDRLHHLATKESEKNDDATEKKPVPEAPKTTPPVQAQKVGKLETKTPPSEILETKQLSDDESGSNQATETVRVKTSVLNALMEMAGEMVLARNRLVRSLADKLEDSDGIGPILHQMSTTTTDVQEQIMRTRLQPIGSLFGRFRRVLRDLSRKLDKKVILETRGGDVELDKRIIEGLADPLTHLLRNSLDHGIESPQQRLAAGKSATGTVTISAYHEAGMVNIDIKDDGRGIDVERIVVKALEKGLITEEQVNRMSERDAMNLIHLPGLSTAKEITDVSGRGVGMDVVRTNIEALGGTIDLTSKRGRGTSVTLKLPLTLAIVSSLIVEAENQRFALPQVGLEEAIRLRPGDNKERIENIRGATVLRHRGRLLPIVKLATTLGLECTYQNSTTGASLADRRQSLADRRSLDQISEDEQQADRRGTADRRRSATNVQRILVLRLGRNRFGLMVDRIVDNEEIVVKPLSSFVRSCPCFSGTTILGDGTISMILDPVGIVQHAGLKFEDMSGDDADSRLSGSIASLKETMPLVLFTNGTEEKMAIPLSQIARIEKISSSDIRRVGSDEYLEYRGTSLPLIRLHNYLPIQSPMEEPSTLNVLIPKVSSHPIGLVTEKVIDAIETDAGFDKETIVGNGIFGSSILENGIVLLVDIYGLMSSAMPKTNESTQLVDGPNGPPRILLAEDTPIYQAILESYLKSAGAVVTTAKDGLEAWELLEKREFDFVVTDMAMPRLDGQELLSKIRESEKLNDLPVLAVSSTPISTDKTSGRKSFSGVAEKLDPRSLIHSLNQIHRSDPEAFA